MIIQDNEPFVIDQSQINSRETHFLYIQNQQKLQDLFEKSNSIFNQEDIKQNLQLNQRQLKQIFNQKPKQTSQKTQKLRNIQQQNQQLINLDTISEHKLVIFQIQKNQFIDIFMIDNRIDLSVIQSENEYKKIQINLTVTDEILQSLNLKNTRYLSIPCSHITNEGLKLINHIPKINLYNNQIITNVGLKHLSNIHGVHTLNLSKCFNITDHGLRYLRGIKVLFIDDNDAITDQGLKHLVGIQEMSIRNNHNITIDGLRYLEGAKLLRLYGCGQLRDITNFNLRGCSIYI